MKIYFIGFFLLIILSLGIIGFITFPLDPKPAVSHGLEDREKVQESLSDIPKESERGGVMPQAPKSNDSLPSIKEVMPVVGSDQKAQILSKIDELVSLYSDEAIDQIAPLLISPDQEVRQSAIEGMRQIALPKAATALRQAAMKTTTSSSDRAAMLEAADFVELPEYQLRSKKNTSAE